MEFIIRLVPLMVNIELSVSLDPLPLIRVKLYVSVVSESSGDYVAMVELAETLSKNVVDEITISVGALFKSLHR